MPISDKYKVIFVHIPKTGGTSVERMLQIPETRAALVNYQPKKGPIYQHFTPQQIIKHIPAEKWESYYKFTTVRHPLQRAISDFKFFKTNSPWEPRLKELDITTFSDYCALAERVVAAGCYDDNPFFDHLRPQHLYFEDIEYDEVCRLENFAADMAKVKAAIGCERPLGRHHTSSGQKVQTLPEDVAIIERVYAKDYERFGYSPLTLN